MLTIKQVIDKAKELGPWYVEYPNGGIRNDNCECPTEAVFGIRIDGYGPLPYDQVLYADRLVDAADWRYQWEPKQIALRRALERELL